MIDLLADNVWPQLRPLLDTDAPRIAAIAYIGRGATEMLAMQAGDILVFDGCDWNIANGSVVVAELRKLRRVGVELYHLEGLHAKLIAVGDPDDPTAAVYTLAGSANASANSRDNLSEAVVVTDAKDAFTIARSKILAWKAAGETVDKDWLRAAAAIPRQMQRGRRPKRRPVTRSLADRSAVMFRLNEYPINRNWTAEEQAAVTAAELANPDAVIEDMRVNADAWRGISVNDTLLLVRNAGIGKPKPNATVWEPVQVVDKLERSSRGAKTLVFAARPDARTSRWGVVRAAIMAVDPDGIGDGFRFSDAARDAVFRHFDNLE